MLFLKEIPFPNVLIFFAHEVPRCTPRRQRMKRDKRQTSVTPENELPFYLSHLMRFYLPICDSDPYAAYLLAYCQELKIISLHEYKEKKAAEKAELEARLSEMSEEERERELDNINDQGYEEYMDRLLNDYNGESFLNEQDDAIEGANGIFDLYFKEAIKAMERRTFGKVPFDEEQIEKRLLEAFHLLHKKGFLEQVWLSERLEDYAIEGVLQACYPQLYERQDTQYEVRKKREATKVQYHVNIAKKWGLLATLTLPEWLETLNHFSWRCAYCLKGEYEVLEHIQPVSMGGGTYLENCVPACVSCNNTKRDSHPEFLPPELDEALEKIRRYFQKRKGQRTD